MPTLEISGDEDVSEEEPKEDQKQEAQEQTFVGREQEVREAMEIVEAVKLGGGSVILVYGEDGIGKTSFQREIATKAGERGFLCMTGTCTDLAEPFSVFWDIFGLEKGRELFGIGHSRFAAEPDPAVPYRTAGMAVTPQRP